MEGSYQAMKSSCSYQEFTKGVHGKGWAGKLVPFCSEGRSDITNLGHSNVSASALVEPTGVNRGSVIYAEKNKGNGKKPPSDFCHILGEYFPSAALSHQSSSNASASMRY